MDNYSDVDEGLKKKAKETMQEAANILRRIKNGQTVSSDAMTAVIVKLDNVTYAGYKF